MKVHNKGQVVIPEAIRRAMGISIGGLVDIEFDLKGHKLKIGSSARAGSKDLVRRLAGRFATTQRKKPISFPKPKQIEDAMGGGLAQESGF